MLLCLEISQWLTVDRFFLQDIANYLVYRTSEEPAYAQTVPHRRTFECIA